MKIRLRNILTLIFITSGLIYFGIVFRYRHEIILAINQASSIKFGIVFIFACMFLFLGHTIRAYKMDEIMQPIKKIKLRTNLRALFVGYLFDILLPFRIGQIIRAYILGSAEKISIGFVFSIIVLERSIDALILGFFSLFLFNYAQPLLGLDLHGFTIISMWLIGISIILFVLLEILYSQNKYMLKFVHYSTELLNPDLRDKTRLSAWSTIYGLQKTLKTKPLVRYAVLSIVMWASYISATLLLATSIFGRGNYFQELIRGISAYLGLAVPTGPSYLGAYKSVTEQILNTILISPNNNTYLVISWILLAVPTSIVGMYALWKTQEDFRSLKKSKETNDMHDKLLRNADTSFELKAFLDSYFSANTLSHILHNIELKEDVRLVRYFKGGSNASTILIHENGEYKVRKITPIQFKKKLIDQYNWLKDKEGLDKIASITSLTSEGNYYSFDIKYYEGYVPFFEYIHSHDIKDSEEILRKVINYMYKNIYKQKNEHINQVALEEYIQKRFINKLAETEKINPYIRDIVTKRKLSINGKEYINCLQVLKKIQSNPEAMRDLATFRETTVHGDLTIDNILASTEKTSEFIIIDPNDENEISSSVIDFAKLFQSLAFGYEFLCRDNSPVNFDNNMINFENSTSASYEKLYKVARKISSSKLTKSEYKSIDFHLGMVYLRMLPYRANINPENILKFYAIAVISFNNFYSQYEN